MASDIHALLESILEQLRRLNRPVVTLLEPELSDAEIRQLTSSLPFPLPDEVTELFAWRNGTKRGAAPFQDMALFPVWFLPPIEQAVEEYRGLTVGLADFWPADSFPILFSGSGDYLGVRCRTAPGGTGEVNSYRLGNTEAIIECSGLKEMLQTVLASYEEGVFFVDADGDFDVDDERFAEVARRFNPGLERWK